MSPGIPESDEKDANHEEAGKKCLTGDGYNVIGGYMSPVNDAYEKKALISSEHRITLCQLACLCSDFIMVDSSEASQSSFQRMLTILSGVKARLCQDRVLSSESGFPNREGQDIEKIISDDDILNKLRDNIKVVEEIIPNQISSIRIRYINTSRWCLYYTLHRPSVLAAGECISRGLSIKYLTVDEVIKYIKQNGLYMRKDD